MHRGGAKSSYLHMEKHFDVRKKNRNGEKRTVMKDGKKVKKKFKKIYGSYMKIQIQKTLLSKD